MILRNTLAQWASLGANFLVGMISAPVMVAYLGKQVYGLWLLLMTVWMVTEMADSGLFLGYVSQLSRERGQPRSQEREVVGSALACFAGLGAAMAVLYAAVVALAPAIFQIPPDNLLAARLALAMLAMVAFWAQISKVYEGLLFVRERLYAIEMVKTGFAVLRLGLIVLFLSLGEGILAVALAHLLASLGGYAAISWMGLRAAGEARRVLPAWNPARIRALLRLALESSPPVLLDRVRLQVPSFMLGVLAGTAQVAVFGVSIRLLAMVQGVVATISTALLPRLFLLNAGKNSQELRRVFLRSTLYTSGLAGSLYLGVFLLAEPFFRLWLGPDFAESAHLARMLVVPLLLYQVATPSAAMLLSLGKQRHLGGLAGLEIAVLLGILLWWPGPADAAKAAAALAVALVCLRPVWLPWFTCRQVGLSLGRYWLAAAGRGLAPVLAMALPLAWLASMWEVDSWGELALAAGAIAAAALGAFLVGGLDSGERAYWRRLLARPRTPGGGEEAP